MPNGIITAANAMSSFQTSLQNTSNNLANVNTTAFKRSVVSYQDVSYDGPVSNQLGNGVQISQIAPRGFAQGTINNTGNPLDVAISGIGFFVVQLPDGTTQYTRDGSFNVDASGRLVTSQGYIVQPPIVIPPNTISTEISADGTVTVVSSSSPTTPKVIGQLQLASFPNQEGLNIEPGNLFSQSVDSGVPTVGTAGLNNLGQLQNGALEQSNVDVTSELSTMVSTQQAYVANSKVITTTNQMVGSALSIIT